MNALDIYSALGNVSEELLEESELTVPKAKPKGVLYMTAAAACFAVLAVGLHLAFGDGGIAAPDRSELISIEETYPAAADVTQYTSPATGETDRTTHGGGVSISDDGLPVDVTDPITEGEANADDAYGNEIEETTLPETGTDGGNVIFPAFTPQTEETSQTAQDDEETAIVPKWADMSDMERYIYLQYNGNEYSITEEKFDERELTFLQNGELYGIDELTDKKYSMPCAFYKINNINENYMIAALTADGNYTAFRNSRYRPDTLGSYLEDIDFSNRCKLTAVKTKTYTQIGDELQTQHFEYRLPDLQQAVEKLLAENSNAVPEINPPPVLDIYLMICGDDTFPTVRISEGGYIGVLGKYFYIGEDKTESFMAYIEENGVKTEYDPYASDGADDSAIPE